GLAHAVYPRHPSPKGLQMNHAHLKFTLLLVAIVRFAFAAENIGVGAKPIDGAEMIIDGTKAMLDDKWIYWEGPGFKSAMPIKWKIVEDPVDKDKGTVLQTDDPVTKVGQF